MLRNPVYKGDHVVCKCHQKAIRSNTYNFVPRDEWEIIENCHEPIVSREQWDRVQKLIDRRPTVSGENRCPFYNLFHGLVYCATCGKSMQVRYEKVGRTDIDRSTKKKREPIDRAYYICQTYNRLGKNACTSHKIEARDLYNLVLADIIEHGKMALQDSEAFYGRLTHRLEQRYTMDEGALKKELDALAKRNQEIDGMFMSLYADKTKGILTEQRFFRMTETLEQEQADNKVRMQVITDELRTANDTEDDVRRFIEEIREYASIAELDETILNRLIDKIIISAVEVIGGEKVQKVRIIYNFVGEIIL
jgi:site-specific DNA recombinase